MNERIIHTKLYSKIALEVLQSVEGQLSDGMWENSPSMEKYWRFSNVTTAPDSEVLIEIRKESGKFDKYTGKWLSNGFANMNDAEIIKWFAAKVKHIMQVELEDNDAKYDWSRDGKFESQYLSYNENITVSDVYFIYDFLMDRDVTKKYEGDISLKIVRAPKSDEETKAEEIRRANIAKLEAEWAYARQKLDIEKRMKIQDLEEEFQKNLEMLNSEYKKKHDLLVA